MVRTVFFYNNVGPSGTATHSDGTTTTKRGFSTTTARNGTLDTSRSVIIDAMMVGSPPAGIHVTLDLRKPKIKRSVWGGGGWHIKNKRVLWDGKGIQTSSERIERLVRRHLNYG